MQSFNLFDFPFFQLYSNSNADVCIFMGVDKNLGLQVGEGGLVDDLAATLHLPALYTDISMQATIATLFYNHSDQSEYKPQIISTLTKLLCFPPAPGKNKS
jgi:hypothetical protein